MIPVNLKWLALGRKLRRRLLAGEILAWCLRLLFVAGVSLAIAGSLALAAGIAPEHAFIAAGVLCLCGFAVVVIRPRTDPLVTGTAQQLARLDHILGLNNALTTAAAGYGPWPAVPDDVDDRLRYEWKRIVPTAALALALGAIGCLLLLPSQLLFRREIPPPRSHGEIDAAIAQLEQTGAVRKEDIEKLKEELDALKSQPAEDWYQHSSLEAADHLQAGMQEQLGSLAQNLNKAQSSLSELDSEGDSLSAQEQQRLAQEFKSAVQGLKDSPLGLNEKLMSALSKVDPSALKSLNQSDLKKIMESMKQTAGTCQKCAGNCKGSGAGDAQSELEKLLGDNPGEGEGDGDGSGKNPKQGEGDGNSRGGISRGPGVAPLPLSSQPTDLNTNKPESLESKDLNRTRPGDAIGVADTEHKLDKTAVGPQSAGAINTQGRGGDAVWRESLLPEEKAVLQKYFK
ncbi:MAG TPA: hypothetical protein VG796_22230 [Verrucomicrobiales bacterium]|nr:hypothetical protein [Verrucomicrobiales bacterium]